MLTETCTAVTAASWIGGYEFIDEYSVFQYQIYNQPICGDLDKNIWNDAVKI